MPRKDFPIPPNYQATNNLPVQFVKKTTFPLVDTFEEEVEQLVQHYNNSYKDGEGMFFNFSKTPKHEKPILDSLVNQHGWVLEKPFFIRKGEPIEDF